MRYFLWIAPAMSLTACLSAAEPAATDAEKHAASLGAAQCMASATHRIDDRISDATTIAGQIVSACNADLQRFDDLTARGESPAYKRLWAEAAYSRWIQSATRIVVEERHARVAR